METRRHFLTRFETNVAITLCTRDLDAVPNEKVEVVSSEENIILELAASFHVQDALIVVTCITFGFTFIV